MGGGSKDYRVIQQPGSHLNMTYLVDLINHVLNKLFYNDLGDKHIKAQKSVWPNWLGDWWWLRKW